jgi:hypothetical protein
MLVEFIVLFSGETIPQNATRLLEEVPLISAAAASSNRGYTLKTPLDVKLEETLWVRRVIEERLLIPPKLSVEFITISGVKVLVDKEGSMARATAL